MTHDIDKCFAHNVLAVAIALALGAGFTTSAWAADDEEEEELRRLLHPDSEVELGYGHVSASGNNKYGDFTGLDEGSNLIANVRGVQRNKDDGGYFAFEGRDLGLDSRSLKVEAGRQGNFGVRLEYSQLPKLFSDSYQTPFVNPGDTLLVLPSTWVATNNTAGMTQLNGSMRSFDVETLRKAQGLGFTKQLVPGWDAALNVKRETKEGNRFIGAVIGNSGGNPRAVILPEPVDYTTDQFEAIIRHAGEKLQLQFGYYGSFFKNANPALAWQNPYLNAAGTAWGNPAVGYPLGYGQLGLPPDNQFHQINASGGYSYSKDTRISGSFSIGRATQNEPYLPYSVNPALAVNVPLPRNSLDGEVTTTHADLKLTSRLTPALQFNAAYLYDDRDNDTPQSQYWYIGGDSQNQGAGAVPTAAEGSRVRTNLPGSSTRQQISAEFDYRLAAPTKLKFGYEYDWVKKTFEAIDRESEHTVKAGINHRFSETMGGGIKYAYSDRRTSAYNAGAPFLASYTYAPYIAGILPISPTDDGLWDNVPTQKKFFLAPRKRDKLGVYANVSPAERVDLQFRVDYNKDDYHKSELGLREATGWAANFDASFAASDALTTYLFASLEKYESDQQSVQLGAVKANYLNPGWFWTVDTSDRTVTVGAGLRYKPSGKFEFGGDLTRADSTGKIDVATGAAFGATPALPLPDVTSTLDRIDLFGRYWVQKDVSVNLKYVYERFRSKDWAYDGVLSNTMGNVIGTNQESPDYKAHLVGVSVSYRF